jgi:hypothetical protein
MEKMTKNLLKPMNYSRLFQMGSGVSDKSTRIASLIQNHVCFLTSVSSTSAAAASESAQHLSKKATVSHSTPSTGVKKLYASSKQQTFKYSNVAEAATSSYSGSTDHTRSGSVGAVCKKRSECSESRTRLTNIRYFYADSEIDKACERPLIRLNPMTMMYMGVSDDNSHLLQSANYLRNELPIRLAHMIKELRNLPFIVAVNPSMLEIHDRCIKSFHDFENLEK